MEDISSTAYSRRNAFISLRWVLALLITSICIIQLCLTYRGMDQPAAMDMAQIARQIARGEGMTTKFLRPIDVWDFSQKEKEDKQLDFDHFAATSHAPVYPYILAAAIKLTGYDDFEAKRMDTENTNVYNGDRVIAGTSTFFFLIALLLTYTLFCRMFDEVVAATTVAFMGLSSLMLQYALSGLPHAFMFCLMLGAAHCLISAIKAHQSDDDKRTIAWVCTTFVLISLLCLTNYMCIWIALGLILFCGFYFTPRGMHAAIGSGILLILVAVPAILILAPTGGIERKIIHGVFNGFGASASDMLMRSASSSGIAFNTSNFFLQLLGFTFAQFNSMYINMGAIFTVPFFLLALFNKFKKPVVEAGKWAVLCMWLTACLGMALFGETKSVSDSQLATLFTPFFAAYGAAMVFTLLSRMQLGESFNAVRALAIAAMLLISSGMFLFQLPRQLYIGIWTSARGIPHFPPYYPAALNGKLHNMTNEKEIVVTDQPWAVAWYADRKALWLPRSLADYSRNLEPVFRKHGQDVQGFLITPSSHSMGSSGVAGVIQKEGDFAPLALEGKLLLLAPKHNMAFAELFNTNANPKSTARPLASLVSSQGVYRHRNFILGAEMIYYSREDVSDKNK